MIVYISGAITNNSSFAEDFDRAEKKLIAEGHEVINPVKTIETLPDDISRKGCMAICLAMLSCCDAIYMVRGWNVSQGAIEELEAAIKANMRIMVE